MCICYSSCFNELRAVCVIVTPCDVVDVVVVDDDDDDDEFPSEGRENEKFPMCSHINQQLMPGSKREESAENTECL